MLILLDIDGVMVSAKSWSSPMILEDGFSVFKANAKSTLNALIKVTNAKIVLTTSHKYRFTIEEWQNIFRVRGIKIDEIDRLPKNEDYLSRKEEIINWYSTSNLEQFVIIDDDSTLHELPKFLKERWVRTKPIIGLTKNHLKELLMKINLPLETIKA